MTDYSGNRLELRVGGAFHPPDTLRIQSGGGSSIISFPSREAAIAAADALAGFFPRQTGLSYELALKCLKRAKARDFMVVKRQTWKEAFLTDPFDENPRKTSKDRSRPLTAEDRAATDWCVEIVAKR